MGAVTQCPPVMRLFCASPARREDCGSIQQERDCCSCRAQHRPQSRKQMLVEQLERYAEDENAGRGNLGWIVRGHHADHSVNRDFVLWMESGGPAVCTLRRV